MPRNPKWKKEGYDYGDATLITYEGPPDESEEGELEEKWTSGKHLGSYKLDTGTVHINPKDSYHLPDTIAHEIAHKRLEHELIRRDRDRLDSNMKALMYDVWGLRSISEDDDPENLDEVVRSFHILVAEFEVRIYQQEKDQALESDNTFYHYLVSQYKHFDTRIEKLVHFYTARQAINNLVRKGFLTKSRARHYRKELFGATKRFAPAIYGSKALKTLDQR